MKVRWTRPALKDLEDIQDFIARDDPRAAHELTVSLFARAGELLAAAPLAGRIGRVPGTRELPLAGISYIVAYRVREDVQILAVVHGARRWPEDFG